MLTIFPSIDVLSKTEFNTTDDWETYPAAEYTCFCGQVISINQRSLSKHLNSQFTNFNKNDDDDFKDFEKVNLIQDKFSFLDFYCPKCHTPVRIYYEFWAGGRYESGYSIKYLIVKD